MFQVLSLTLELSMSGQVIAEKIVRVLLFRHRLVYSKNQMLTAILLWPTKISHRFHRVRNRKKPKSLAAKRSLVVGRAVWKLQIFTVPMARYALTYWIQLFRINL